MSKRNVRYPHTIGFRVTDETWFAIQREISNTDLTPHDWCRMVVLDSLNRGFGLTKKERIFYEQAAAIRYLIANGFQLLADDRLTTDEWKKLRLLSKEKIDIITDRALADCRERMNNNGQRQAKADAYETYRVRL
jgi:hypothetical protein